MFSGSVVINGVSDADLVKILDIKIKHETSVFFNPQQLQAISQGNPPRQTYNNVILNWQNEDGMEAVHQIISTLLKKEQRVEKAA